MPITKSRQIAKLLKLDGSIKDSLYDSDAIVTSAQLGVTPAAGTAVYSSADTLPASADNGDQALVSSTNRFYIFTNSGWYNIALINNTPYWITEANSSYDLSTTGTATTITMLAQDSEGINIVYTATTDSDFNQIATVTKDSDNGRVFTIIPTDSENGTAIAGTGTITFRASDGVNLVSTLSSFSIVFKVTNSNYSTLLLKADTAGTDNQVDASTNNYTVTENGNVTSTALSPYHPGGYSTYAGTADADYISFPASSNYDFGSAWQIELWTYVESWETGPTGAIFEFYNNDTNYFRFMQQTSDLRLQLYSGGSEVVNNIVVSGELPAKAWDHWVITWNNSQFQAYRNGTKISETNSGLSVPNISTWALYLFQDFVNEDRYKNGYIRDLKITTGTLTVTGTSYTVPTSPVSADNDTQLLTCHLPYISDGSSNNATPTISGGIRTVRVSPYDYLGYAKADHGGSVYFDGSGDYLSIVDDNMTSTGEFTVEGWFYSTSAVGQVIFHWSDISDGKDNDLILGNDGSITCRVGSGGNTLTSSSTGLWKVNIWHHFAVVRNSSNNVDVYLDGKHIIDHGVRTDDMDNTLEIGRNPYNGGGSYFIGYISNFRILDGTALYTSAFTPPTTPLTAIANTQLLTCTNKNDIWDASTGELLTKSGDVTASATQRKFTTSDSMYFDGTGDDIRITGYNPPIAADDFTVECWVYITARNSSGAWLFQIQNGHDVSNGNGIQVYYRNTSNSYNWAHLTGGSQYNTTTASVLNTWTHVAITRSGSSVKLFIDGSLIDTQTISTDMSTYDDVTLGTGYGNRLTGYIQDFRITKGLARYTANFTPSTTAFVDDANTLTLLHMDGADGSTDFQDDNGVTSRTPFSYTASGDAQISTTQNKFGGSSLYTNSASTATQIVSDSNYTFGTGDFTIEAWVYLEDDASGYVWAHGTSFSDASNIRLLNVASTDKWQLRLGDTNYDTSATVSFNTWTHLALVRNSGTVNFYVDGVQDTTIGSSGDVTFSTDLGARPMTLANLSYASVAPWQGYIDEFRISDVARYTANFTPPTAEFKG